MSLFSRLGAIFLLCVFSIHTIASTVCDTAAFSNKKLTNQQEQFLRFQNSNNLFICQEPAVFAIDKYEKESFNPNFDLEKFTILDHHSFEDSNLLSKSKTQYAYAKVLGFNSVKIIFPFHNFW